MNTITPFRHSLMLWGLAFNLTALVGLRADAGPVAVATPSANPVSCSQPIIFDGSSSSSPDHAIVSYAWDFGDAATASGVTAFHAFPHFGSFVVTLIITDDNVPAQTATNTVTVNVNQGNQAPTANAGGPYSNALGNSLNLNGTASTDPNAACGDRIVLYQWDVNNDGTYDLSEPTVAVTPTQLTSFGLGNPGTHTIRLRVTDSLGLSATATTTVNVTNPYIYTTNAGTITITGYTGAGGVVSIPDTITGLPVTSIAEQTFYIYYGDGPVTSLTIPDSVTSIEERAFYQCYSLTNVTLGNGVTNIGNIAFEGCSSLASVTIPNGVITIGYRAFNMCDSLTSVTIPASVTSIGEDAFALCSSLPAITVDALNSFYSSVDGVLFNKSQSTIVRYPEGKAGSYYTIPASVVSIGLSAFSFCTSLTNVTLPNGVTNIDYYAFDRCSNLTGVYFQGNAPGFGVIFGGLDVFSDDNNATVYCLPGTTGWGATYAGRPTALWIVNSPALTLTNIVITPPNLVIGIGSNRQFTATGYYSDGSFRILTNGGSVSGGNWVAVAGLPVAKTGQACAVVNGHLYVVSGTVEQSVWEYNPTLNTWANKAPLPSNICDAGAVGIGNKLYYMGGFYGANALFTTGALYIYDTLTDGWTTGAAMIQPRNTIGVGVIDGKIYVAGGASGSGFTCHDDLQIYDPVSDAWTNGHALPSPRSHSGSAVINGKLYIVGGYDAPTHTTFGSLFVYDPATDSWTTNASMPTPRYALGATTVGGLLYAIDGNTASDAATNLVEVYNPVTDTWSTGAPTLTGHFVPQPVAINGAIYLAASDGQSYASTNVEAYTPQTSLWSSSSSTVAFINTNGLATGLSNGITSISATSDGISGYTTLTVLSPPAISIQPTNNTVSPSGSVTLNVAATGSGLSYQWQLNGTNITGATGASLTITNVTSAYIGVYTVIVNNAVGSVTSSSAMLTSVDIHMLASVYVDGPVGANYLIQAAANLSDGWTTLTNIALPSQPYVYVDYASVTNKQRFYRAVPQ